MNETRLPSGDPLSTRTRSEEGSWELAVADGDVEIRLFEDDLGVLMEDSDLRLRG